MKKYLRFFAPVLVLVVIATAFVFANGAFADHDPYGGEEMKKITLCHDESGDGLTYHSSGGISVNAVGGHEGHTTDIIPPFHYAGGSYPGQNWSAETEDIWNDGACDGDGVIDPDPVYACSDEIDNDDAEDELVDASDPGCHTDGDAGNPDSYDPADNDETDPVVPVDVCSNIDGDQATVPDGYQANQDGTCSLIPPPPTDFCPNIEGVQESVPEGYQVNEGGDCELIPPPPVDVCTNLEGVQETTPEGYTNNDGTCTPIVTPTDFCPNIDGIQESVPEGYQVNEGGDCELIPPPPVDVCSNLEGTQTQTPDGYTNNDGICTPIITPTDVCSNIEGNQETVPEGYTVNDGICTEIPNEEVFACSDDLDNDSDEVSDANDPGCHTDGDAGNPDSYDPNDNDESNPTNNGGGNSSGSIPNNRSTGRVLGASTVCGDRIDTYMRRGYANNPASVMKLQQLLVQTMGITLTADGVYGPATENAVNQFQTKYADKVLTPWGLTQPTGIFYLSTLETMNWLLCPDVEWKLPTLVPWSSNPLFKKN